MRTIRRISLFMLAILSINAWAAGYDIKRESDGPFSFSISGVKINEGSTLQRESILFNDPSSPVTLDSHKIKIVYEDRGFQFKGTTSINVSNKVQAIQVRTILYDVFGKQMKNLANTEPKDFSPGNSTLSGTWSAYGNDSSELLTSVTYVARVRYEDGKQWVFNESNLILALSSLKLEKKIGEDDDNKPGK